MKVNLECGNDIRSGYLNVSSWPEGVKANDLPDHTRFAVGMVNNLDPILKDGEAEEIIFNPQFNVVTPQGLVPIIEHWHKKLMNGGRLKLSYIDIKRVGRAVHLGDLNLQEADHLIYGPGHSYHTLIDTNVLKGVLSHLGFTIDLIDLKQFFGTIEAVKNNVQSQN